MSCDIDTCEQIALETLQSIIRIPSVSREESAVANHLVASLKGRGLESRRRENNVWMENRRDGSLPTILLNSHIDTVKPVEGWTRDPHGAEREGDRIYGLGSNDAGGPLVSLLAAFLYLSSQAEQPYNLVFAATAEEEISGKNGVSLVLKDLGDIALGIVGEPTNCRMAVAEKGLMVVDARSSGESAHAASGLGRNAIYSAMRDIEWIRGHRFDTEDGLLGPVSMAVTQIVAGTQHNVVPDSCDFVIDVRTNEHHRNEEVFEVMLEYMEAGLKARSFRLAPSSIPADHPLVKRGRGMGLESYGSLTLSDQALMPFTTLKIGPGDPRRSHSADEYITVQEIRQGINTYIQLLNGLELT